jgi:hypothetical protein
MSLQPYTFEVQKRIKCDVYVGNIWLNINVISDKFKKEFLTGLIHIFEESEELKSSLLGRNCNSFTSEFTFRSLHIVFKRIFYVEHGITEMC